jgi:hypothetical protein
MKPSEVSTKLRQIASAIESSKSPRPDLVAQDVALLADIVAGKKKKKTPKSQKRGDCVFPHTSNKVKDNKDHFPINSESQARNALSRANQYSESPSWYDGSLQELVSAVARKVHSKYPDIEVSEASKKPGKGKGKGKKKRSSMKPSEVSHVLNQIATAIDNSESPRADLVITDIKKVVAAMGSRTAQHGNYYIFHTYDNDEMIVDLGNVSFDDAHQKLVQKYGAEDKFELLPVSVVPFDELLSDY